MALEACGDTVCSPSPPPSPDGLLVSGNISVADISATDWVLWGGGLGYQGGCGGVHGPGADAVCCGTSRSILIIFALIIV